jgi:hypothetical protein
MVARWTRLSTSVAMGGDLTACCGTPTRAEL